MNVFFKSIALLIFVRASAVEVLKKSDFASVENDTEWIEDGTSEASQAFWNKMNSTVYTSVNHFYCADETFKDPVMIVYGTKSWTFPTQDVNLTLSYPSANLESEYSSDEHGYIITGFKVVLYVDGKETKGYIMGGGVLQDAIVLSFISKFVSSLSYEFWIYGIPKHSSGITTELTTHYFVCK